MKAIHLILLCCFVCLTSLSHAQFVKRVEISGLVKANTNDVLGVTIYNLASKKGAITSDDGTFKIEVAANDVLDVSSLVFKDFKVTITEEDLKNKFITVFLVEMVNNLDEVLILRGDLTGLLDYDVANVPVFNTTIDIDFESLDLSKYDFSDDYKSAAENIITRQGEYHNMMNPIEVIKLFSKLFKSKKQKSTEFSVNAIPQNVSLEDKYLPAFYVENFNIPKDKVQAFLAFLEKTEFDASLLNDANEIHLLEYIKVKSDLFLKDN